MIKFIFGVALILYGFYRTLFIDPVWGIYLFAVLTHIRLNQLGENIHLPLGIPIVIAVTTLILYLVSPKYERKFARWPLEVWLFGVMVAGMALSSTFAHYNPALSWDRTYDFFKYWIFFVLLIQMIDSLQKIEWFHQALILSAAWLVFRCWDLRGTTGFRFENVGGDVIADANHFSAALVLLFPFVFKKTLSSERWVAVGAITLCFGMVMSVFIAASRGGFLGCLALFVLILVNFRPHRKKMGAMLLVIAATVLLFANADQKQRLFGVVDTTNEETRDASAQGRIDYWKLSWQVFLQHKLTGVGIGNFPYYSGPALEKKDDGQSGHVAHSIWFETLAEGGLLVFVPFLLLLIGFFRKSGRLLRDIRLSGIGMEHEPYILTMRMALAAFLVSATFLNRLIYEPIYWCIAFGVIHCNLVERTKSIVPAALGGRVTS